MTILIGVIGGLFVAVVYLFVFALCSVAKRADEEMEQYMVDRAEQQREEVK